MNPQQTFAPGCGFLSSAEIDDALNGRLPQSRFAEFDGHVEDGCAECVTLAADLNLFRAVAAGEPLEVERREDDAHAETFRERLRREVRAVHPVADRAGVSREPAGRSFGWGWALGAAAMLMLAVGGWFVMRGPGGTPGSLSIPLPGGGSYVAQVKPFESAPVLRGDPGLRSAWSRAESAYREGNYDAAERDLATIVERTPDSLDALIYRGVSLLALERNAEAREAFELARAVALAEEASLTSIAWFQALAALSDGDRDAGRDLLREAAAGSGAYADLARDLLGKLDQPSSREEP